MKMKKFFSGFLAAIMSIATTIAMPLSTAIAEDDPPAAETGKIIINHAATTGTYMAYPIFVGNVEQEKDDEGKKTGRLIIDTPEFHPNLETTIGYREGDVIARVTENPQNNENYYGLYFYLNNSSKTIGGKSFEQLMKEYDSNATGINHLSSEAKTASSNKDAAEAIANLLNLTCKNSPTSNVDKITSTSNKGAAFYSAFAEAARMFMVDKIVTLDGDGNKVANPGEMKDVKTGGAVKDVNGKKVVEIEITKPGYYLVEYTPTGSDTSYDEPPKAVRRALVLVGLGDDCAATINSKDTENVASIDIQFNETLLKEEDGKYVYNGDEGEWAKNVSAGNGDYVNCRVVITLPGNLAAYDQYYLAVPIMYGYNVETAATFDGRTKSVKRVEGSGDDPLKYIKVYFLDGEGNKTRIIRDYQAAYSDFNSTDLASEIFGGAYDHNATLTINESYTYADETTSSNTANADKFKATETFIISDIANMYVRTKWAYPESETYRLKSNYANPQDNDSWSKFVIEFPVKFERFDKEIMNDSATASVSNLGYDSSSPWGDDLLMKNYISAKLVYSNNPNLKVLTEDEMAYDKANNPDGVKLYLDTSKDPGTLQNPVFVTKDHVSANIVTYRLRVHATTEDLVKICQAGGIEYVRFAIKNSEGKYAKVVKDTSIRTTYDEVEGEKLRDRPDGALYPSSFGIVSVYKIVGWVDLPEDGTVPEDSVLRTHNTFSGGTPLDGVYRNSNSARFEIVGIAPGDYTVVALDEVIKANDAYLNAPVTTNAKEYKLPREGNKLKTEYRFSFAPELNQEIGKQNYYTHFAPVGSTDPSSNPGNPVFVAETMITNYNLKWYDMNGNELTGGKGDAEKPDWWLGQREDVGLMSMRVTYIKKGLTLPVTGGIGTFIFFAVGGALVVISTVAIVTKFRIKREQL